MTFFSSIVGLFVSWQFGLGVLFLSAAPAIAYLFVIQDDSSKHRKFFYNCVVVSTFAFSIYLVDCLVTFWAEIEIFCNNLVAKRPTSKNLDPQSFDN